MGRRVIFSGGVSVVRNFGMIKTSCLHTFDDWFYPDYILYLLVTSLRSAWLAPE